MIIDLRHDEDTSLRNDVRVLLPTTKNQLVLYCQKRLIKPSDVDSIYLGDGGMVISEAAALASNIATHFKCPVHFECKNSPGTCFPDVRAACVDNYKMRRAAGERVISEEPDVNPYT